MKEFGHRSQQHLWSGWNIIPTLAAEEPAVGQAAQLPLFLAMLTAWIQFFYPPCEQISLSPSLHADLHRLAAQEGS